MGASRAWWWHRPSRPIRRAVVTRAAGALSERARNRVLTPDSSSPGGNYPLWAEDPTDRPAKCSGSLDRPVLAHLCTIRPKNSGNGVASLAGLTGTTRSRSVGAARLVCPSREPGRRDRGGSMSTPRSDVATPPVRCGGTAALAIGRTRCALSVGAPGAHRSPSVVSLGVRRRRGAACTCGARQASQTFGLTAPEGESWNDGTHWITIRRTIRTQCI